MKLGLKDAKTRTKLLLVLAGLALGFVLFTLWQFVFIPRANAPFWSYIPGSSDSIGTPIAALQNTGVSLMPGPEQSAEMSQRQALLLANQLEPDEASKAQHIYSQYVLVSYVPSNGSTGSQSLVNVPAWLIWYQHIPLQANDPAVDPTPLAQTQQDLYVFIDDHTGRELLALWS